VHTKENATTSTTTTYLELSVHGGDHCIIGIAQGGVAIAVADLHGMIRVAKKEKGGWLKSN